MFEVYPMMLEVCCKLKKDHSVSFPLHLRYEGKTESFCGQNEFNWDGQADIWLWAIKEESSFGCEDCLRIHRLVENL